MGAAGRPEGGRYLLRHREEGSAGTWVINGQTEALLLPPGCDPRLAGHLGGLQRGQEGGISREMPAKPRTGRMLPAQHPQQGMGRVSAPSGQRGPAFPERTGCAGHSPPSPGSHPACSWLDLCSHSQQIQEENATPSLLMDKGSEPSLPWHFGFWGRAAQPGHSNAHKPLQGRFAILGVFLLQNKAPTRAKLAVLSSSKRRAPSLGSAGAGSPSSPDSGGSWQSSSKAAAAC